MSRKPQAWNKEHAPGPMRAVRHPTPGAPWPLRAADGTAVTEKELARDTRLRAGPTPGIADACSHKDNSR
jgi:hypothetical protein